MELLKGKYIIDGLLGRGGMAEVYLGRTLGAVGFTRQVAIKRILRGHLHDARFREMFVKEAQLCARLAHPNIVAVLDFDEDSRGLFLVMEYVDGVDLHKLLKRGPLPVPLALFLTSQILAGLGHAHELSVAGAMRGVIHRDVSPHNVLITRDGTPKVADFGIAKALDTSAATGSIVKGTPSYMSPEHANGAPLDGRSDLFSVGVILWEMLCGEPLFARGATQATLRSVLFDPIPSPRVRCPELSPDIEAVTMTLLQRDPAERYPGAGAAIEALAACHDWPRNGRPLLAALIAERLPPQPPAFLAEQPAQLEDAEEPAAGSGAEAVPSPQRPPTAFVAVADRALGHDNLDDIISARLAANTSTSPLKSRAGIAAAILAAVVLGTGLGGALLATALREESGTARTDPTAPAATGSAPSSPASPHRPPLGRMAEVPASPGSTSAPRVTRGSTPVAPTSRREPSASESSATAGIATPQRPHARARAASPPTRSARPPRRPEDHKIRAVPFTRPDKATQPHQIRPIEYP